VLVVVVLVAVLIVLVVVLVVGELVVLVLVELVVILVDLVLILVELVVEIVVLVELLVLVELVVLEIVDRVGGAGGDLRAHRDRFGRRALSVARARRSRSARGARSGRGARSAGSARGARCPWRTRGGARSGAGACRRRRSGARCASPQHRGPRPGRGRSRSSSRCRRCRSGGRRFQLPGRRRLVDAHHARPDLAPRLGFRRIVVEQPGQRRAQSGRLGRCGERCLARPQAVVAAPAARRVLLAEVLEDDLAAAARRLDVREQRIEPLAVGDPARLVLARPLLQQLGLGRRIGDEVHPAVLLDDELLVLEQRQHGARALLTDSRRQRE